jgi:nicotinate-nucleotide pyrophosphorylase (carboxylating)
MMEINNAEIGKFIDYALKEDIGDGDHTSLATISAEQKGKAQLVVKQEGVIAGIEVAKMIFQKLDKSCLFTEFFKDGLEVKPGDVVFQVEGKVIFILQAERLVLNIMQRMSGIATQTRQYVNNLRGLNTRILDTRKTSPGMRVFDKYAVKVGGGENHRIGLYDMILIKDNHIDFAGGIEKAIEKTHTYLDKTNKDLKIEIEARSLDDVNRILTHEGVHRILLDNFTPEMTQEAVKLINGKVETESSGNITLENIRQYAECGVDYISVGALTHQIKSLDLSLKAC